MEEYESVHDFLNTAALKYFGIQYLFPYQRLVITNILEAAGVNGFAPQPGRNSVTGEMEKYDINPYQIVILPTGAGKSLCFMLPVPLINGITLVIFPLLSLIADQARRLRENNFSPSILRGGQSKTERNRIWNNVRTGKSKIILSNPETLLQPDILEKLKPLHIKHLVIDEMHIVSEWGDTFRPSYLAISRIYKEADIDVVTAFTATASEVILSRVKRILFPDSSPSLITADPDRPNIRYRVVRTIAKNHDLYKLSAICPKPLLVFCRSRTSTELTARYLRQRLGANNIFFYHAGLAKKEKKEIENWFYNSTDGILAATCAYGMGVDKQNIRTVIHLDPPPSVEAYLQESGRAGRDRKEAEAVILISESDFTDTQRMDNPVLKQRYLTFLHGLANNNACRRVSLLKLLGVTNESCSGCDVCDKKLQKEISGITDLSGFVKKHSRKTTLREAVLTLSGKKYLEVYLNGYDHSLFYEALCSWTEEEIKEGIIELMKEGIISVPKHGPYKNLLIYHRKKQKLVSYSLSTPQMHSSPFADRD